MIDVIKRKVASLVFNRSTVGEFLNGFYDIRHHKKYAFREENIENDKAHLKYYLTKHYHIIEKGLALPAPRYGFGQPKILDVIEKSRTYERAYGEDKLIHSIKKTLSEYLIFHDMKSYSLPTEFSEEVKSFIGKDYASINPIYEGGLKVKVKQSSTNIGFEEFKAFVESRSSVRNFSEEEVSSDTIYAIVEAAKSAPSVCNRQAWKVHYYSDKNRIQEILSYQNGNLGFRDAVNKLIIVTADTKGFTKREHNQAFIDGGLFAQNILLAIHAAGLGACPLNTCYNFYDENKVKRICNIPKNERLIMMIAIGSLKDDYSVAYSPRNPIEDVLITH